MPTRVRGREETGVAAVVVALVLVVLMGAVALTIDGGLLWVKYRQVRTANDAAALSWAQSCARGDADAETVATQVARLDGGEDLNLYPGFPQFGPEGCARDHGSVTVRYGGDQGLLFGPAVGVSSPKPVVAQATAIWGGSGGSADVIPLVLMKDRLSSCNVVPMDGKPLPQIGDECVFWWDDGALGSSSWGFMTLATWGTDGDADPADCSAVGGTGDIQKAIQDGLSEPLLLEPGAPEVPTYVCVRSGVPGTPVDNSIQQALAAGRIDFALPVSDESKQIDSTQCNPQGCTTSPYKYAIIGFAFVRPVDLYKRNEDGYDKCRTAGIIPPDGESANSFCIVVSWQGYSFDGLAPGAGPNLGQAAVALTE